VTQTVYANIPVVLTQQVGTMAQVLQRHVLFTPLRIAVGRPLTPITFTKEVLSICFQNRIAAVAESSLMTRVILKYQAQISTFVPIYRRKMEFLKSSRIVHP
jgi:hypothetical protein